MTVNPSEDADLDRMGWNFGRIARVVDAAPIPAIDEQLILDPVYPTSFAEELPQYPAYYLSWEGMRCSSPFLLTRQVFSGMFVLRQQDDGQPNRRRRSG
jgi:hypothetical protein